MYTVQKVNNICLEKGFVTSFVLILIWRWNFYYNGVIFTLLGDLLLY